MRHKVVSIGYVIFASPPIIVCITRWIRDVLPLIVVDLYIDVFSIMRKLHANMR